MAKVGDREYTGWSMVSSGYAAVWARENTRKAIFDAMMRKETYATTGRACWCASSAAGSSTRRTRPADFRPTPATPRACRWAATCPPHLTARRRPSWSAALKDPLSGNLDRIQIVKVWMEGTERREKVYDVAWSGDRQPGSDGKLPAVGNTVDVAKATWTNTIGAPELLGVWTDPEFDPEVRAAYYARVIEIPTPRWTAYEAARYGIEMSSEVPMTTQERAYTSPIWYTP